MKIKFTKFSDKAITPTKGTSGSAGFDLYVASASSGHNGGEAPVVCINTDIGVEIPRDYVGLIFPRSSIYKTDLRLTNCVGVIDSDYRGPIKAVFDIKPNGPREKYVVGDRCCQLVIVPIPEIELVEVDAEELSKTERGAGGFGSTGRA